jgi:hypothetical protein
MKVVPFEGYPLSNIIFEDTRSAVLYQSGTEALRVDLRDHAELVGVLGLPIPSWQSISIADDVLAWLIKEKPACFRSAKSSVSTKQSPSNGS